MDVMVEQKEEERETGDQRTRERNRYMERHYTAVTCE